MASTDEEQYSEEEEEDVDLDEDEAGNEDKDKAGDEEKNKDKAGDEDKSKDDVGDDDDDKDDDGGEDDNKDDVGGDDDSKDEFNDDDFNVKDDDKEDDKHEEKEEPDITPEEMKRQAMGVGSESDDPATARHRRAFNLAAYGRQGDEPFKAPAKSKRFQDDRYRKYIVLLRKWSKGDQPTYERYRRKHKQGYPVEREFDLEEITMEDDRVKFQLRKKPTSKNAGGIVVPMSRVFDAIKSAHSRNMHMMVAATYLKLKDVFWNITEAEVKAFCRTCPVCLTDPPKVKPKKGSNTPIRSAKFGDRMQVDLIDMQRHQCRNQFGNMIKYVLVAKDHFTGYVWLRGLPQKSASHTASCLEPIFGDYGYPRILQTDNGKEFTGRMLLEELYARCPGLLTVYGRPRTPRDQGSVENMNKHVKARIFKMEEELRQRGIRPNWTTCLGSVQFELNKKRQKGPYGVSSWETVHGDRFKDHGGVESFAELRKAKTVAQRLKLEPPGSDFHQMMTNNRWMDTYADDSSDQDHCEYEDESSGDEAYGDDIIDVKRIIRGQELRKIRDRDWVSMEDAWEKGYFVKLNRNRRNEQVLTAYLNCTCTRIGEQTITIPDDETINAYATTNIWFEHDFIIGFGQMLVHKYHRNDIEVIPVLYNDQDVSRDEMIPLRDTVKVAYAVLHSQRKAHYVVCAVRVEQKKIIIFDGLKTTLASWFKGILKVLCYCSLISDENSVDIKEQAPTKFTIEDKDDKEKTWSIYGPIAHMKQEDGHSCGPIVCHKLMTVFGRTPEVHDVLTWLELRKLVTDDYRALMKEVEDDICVPVPVGGNETTNETTMNAKKNEKQKDDDNEDNDDESKLSTKKISNRSKSKKRKRIQESPSSEAKTSPSNPRTPKVSVNKESETKSPPKKKGKIDKVREEASAKKGQFRSLQRKKMRRQHEAEMERRIAKKGDVISIKLDPRDVPGARGITGVVYQVGKGGGVLAVCTMGVFGSGKEPFWIPIDRYGVITDRITLPEQLSMIRVSILMGTFEPNAFKLVTLQQVHRSRHETRDKETVPENDSEAGEDPCKCKKKCTKRCRCVKRNEVCSETCGCGGKGCGNPLNDVDDEDADA